MKKEIIIYLLSAVICWQLASCSAFETEPLNVNSEARVLDPGDSTDNSSVKRLFYACYLSLPNLHNRLNFQSYLDAATDDGLPTRVNSQLDYFRNNLVTASNLPDNPWSTNYRGIRYVNDFLSKVDIFPPSKQVPAYYIKQMKAEARLLRAYYYFEMLKRWGGVPLLGDKVLGVNDDLNIPRATIQEVADYITGEISPDVETSCFKDLPPAQSIADDSDPATPENMIGHVNQGVALALLSRLHLYLASDLYNESRDVNKWQTAADWAKRLIDLGVYELDANTVPARQFAMTETEFPNKEMIMIKMSGTPSTSIEQANAPTGFSFTGSSGLVNSNGYTSPSQNLVDAFLTIDGKSIFNNYDPKEGYIAGYSEQDPYSNRDPRLGRFIFHNGSRWLNREVETFDGGAHRGAQQGIAYTRTGYYLKKFLGNNETTANYTAYYNHHQIIRYAEVLLNYAEAVNESDPTNDAEIVSGLIDLRKRAGINAGADQRYGLPAPGAYDQELMRRIIRNERRIELCFEEHRFWDIRRWKIAEDVMNQPVRGIRIIKETDDSFLYTYENAASSSFLSYMYWYPIPRAELYGNKALKQNQGWSY